MQNQLWRKQPSKSACYSRYDTGIKKGIKRSSNNIMIRAGLNFSNVKILTEFQWGAGVRWNRKNVNKIRHNELWRHPTISTKLSDREMATSVFKNLACHARKKDLVVVVVSPPNMEVPRWWLWWFTLKGTIILVSVSLGSCRPDFMVGASEFN